MTSQALVADIGNAARAKRRENKGILDSIAKNVADEKRRKELASRSRRRTAVTRHQRIRKRVELAWQGVDALCALGQTSEFASLIEARGKKFILWGGQEITCAGYDMSDVHWKWVNYVAMTATELQLVSYTASSGDYGATFKDDSDKVRMMIPYTTCQLPIFRSLQLWKIASSDEPDEYQRKDFNFQYSPQMLFEVLVRCAEPKKLSRLLRNALQ